MRKLGLGLNRTAREFGALALAFTIGTVAFGVNETRAAEDLIDPKAMTILVASRRATRSEATSSKRPIGDPRMINLANGRPRGGRRSG